MLLRFLQEQWTLLSLSMASLYRDLPARDPAGSHLQDNRLVPTLAAQVKEDDDAAAISRLGRRDRTRRPNLLPAHGTPNRRRDSRIHRLDR